TVIPQAVLLLGNAFAGDDPGSYFHDNWRDVFPILASSLALSLFIGGVALLIAAQTPRRAFATGGILAYFAIGTTVGSVLVEAGGGPVKKLGTLVSGFHTMRGVTYWLFDRSVGSPNQEGGGIITELAKSGLDLAWYAVAAGAIVAVS